MVTTGIELIRTLNMRAKANTRYSLHSTSKDYFMKVFHELTKLDNCDVLNLMKIFLCCKKIGRTNEKPLLMTH